MSSRTRWIKCRVLALSVAFRTPHAKFVSAAKARMALRLKGIWDASGGTVNLALQS